MARVIICLFLTLAFAFGSYTSFMSNDYPALKRWMTYYKEYKELQGALDKGNASKAEMLDKLRTMYPEKAAEIERQFESKYGNLKDSAEEAGSDIQHEWDSRVRDDGDSLRSRDESSDSQNHPTRRHAVKNRRRIPAVTIPDPSRNHRIVPPFTTIIAQQTKKTSNLGLFLFINKELIFVDSKIKRCYNNINPEGC